MQQREYINGEVANQLNHETARSVTNIVTTLMGGDAKETAFEFFKKKFEDEFEGEFYWSGIDGISFNIMPYEDMTFVGSDEMTRRMNTQMPWKEHPDDKARGAFDFIHDCMKCQVCPLRLARCSDFGICRVCQKNWHEVPCRVCKSQFGFLTDGKHSWC